MATVQSNEWDRDVLDNLALLCAQPRVDLGARRTLTPLAVPVVAAPAPDALAANLAALPALDDDSCPIRLA